MARQIIMDYTGDTRHEFDPKDQAAVLEANKRFMELTGLGFIAAERTGEGTHKLVRSFDPEAEETTFFRQLKGG